MTDAGDAAAEAGAESIPWKRVTALLRPLRHGVLAMCALSTSGVLIGLVPPPALGH